MSETETLQENQVIRVYSTVWCSDCKRAKQFFGEQRVPYINIDIEQDEEAMAYVEKVNDGKRIVPTILFPDGSKLVEPSNAELAAKMGLQTKAQREFYPVIIVGSGPTGLTASIYLEREGIETLVVEKGSLGGQVSGSQMLDNYPGFPEGIAGIEFADRLVRQARRFGVEILQAQEVTNIAQEGPYLCVNTSDQSQYGCKAVLIATGAHYRKLNIPGEESLIGTSIHFCATCDGPFYRGKKILVVGGGNSGFEEGLLLTKYASQVDIVEFMPEVRASKILQDTVRARADMHITTNHEILEFKGKKKLDKVVVRDRATGEVKEWNYDGVFIFIGVYPNSGVGRGMVEIDPQGFIVTDKTLMTKRPGIFAAGDVRAESTKQVAAAAGEGATAALMIREYLKEVG